MSDSYDAYRSVDLHARANAASPYQLVLVLFDGLLDELDRARGHIQARRYELKGRSLEKAMNILKALDGALDHQQGGEVVENLAQLYQYCIARLCEVSASLSIEGLDEVLFLLRELRQGWESLHVAQG